MNMSQPIPISETPADSSDKSPNGEAVPAAEDDREARRRGRLSHLEILRTIGMEMAAGLGHATAGRVQFNYHAFAKTNDPALAFSRLALAVRQIVALEERLDEDAETRAARMAEEQAQRAEMAARRMRTEKREQVRRAVRTAHRRAEPDMALLERENLLNDLFRDYDDYNRSGATMAEIVAEICAALGVETDMSLWRDDPPEDGPNANGGVLDNRTKPDDPPKDLTDLKVDPADWADALAAFEKKHRTVLAANDASRSRGRGPPDG